MTAAIILAMSGLPGLLFKPVRPAYTIVYNQSLPMPAICVRRGDKWACSVSRGVGGMRAVLSAEDVAQNPERNV